MQGQLWLSENGFQKTRELRSAVAEHRALNESLKARNAALDAEVINLKQGLEAAEERADFTVMEKLLDTLSQPYQDSPEQAGYHQPPPPSAQPYQTFCGT